MNSLNPANAHDHVKTDDENKSKQEQKSSLYLQDGGRECLPPNEGLLPRMTK